MALSRQQSIALYGTEAYTGWSETEAQYDARARRTARKYTSDMYMKCITGATSIAFPATGFAFDLLNVSVASMVNNTTMQTQLTGIDRVYRQFKIRRVVREYWLNDNDELVKADQTIVDMYHCYDPQAYNRTLTQNSIICNPGHKFIQMKPFQRYRISMRPVWDATQENVIGLQQTMKGGWMDMQYTRTTSLNTKTCTNGHQVAFWGKNEAETQAIFVRTTYYLQFRGRQQGWEYNS